MPATRHLAPALVLLLAVVACTPGGLLGGPAPAGQASASPGLSGVTIAGGAKVLAENQEVRVIQQVLPRGATSWLRLPYREFFITTSRQHQVKAQLLVAAAGTIPAITWTTSNPGLVAVERGMLRSFGQLGTATITAEAGGQKVSMTVAVVGQADLPATTAAQGSVTGGTGTGTGGDEPGTPGSLIVAAAGEPGELVYARRGAYALTYNGGSAIMVLGGSDGSKALNSKEAAPFIRTLSGDSLGVEPDFVLESVHLFITAREGLTATLAGMHLYVFGGAGTTVVEQLDPSDIKPFQPTALNLLTPRRYHGTVDTPDWIALIGGEDGNGTPLRETEGAIKLDTDDPTVTALGTFEAGEPLTQARAGVGAVRVGDFIFAIGGKTAGGPSDTIERASASGGKPTNWLALDAIRLNQARAYHQVVRGADNSIYVIGGESAAGEAINTIERARVNQDGSINPFEYVGRLQFARSRFGATFTNGTIVVAGGKTATGITADVEYIAVDQLSPARFAQPSATPTPAATATPTPAPTATPTAAPTATPTPAPTATPTPTPLPTATPTPAPTPTPTPAGP